MPPSDPTCPTCGTQVRANDYWSYLAGPSSPRVYYPKSIMDDNPEIAGTFTRCADPFHAAPSDPAACPNCTSPQRGVRYSDDPGALCGHSWHDKPSDPAAVPPPEWALDAAHEYFSDQWTHLGIPKGIAVNVSPLARLLASVREGALREGADLCHEIGVKRSEDAKTSTPEWVDAMRQQARGAFTCYRAMCGLRREPPSGGAG